MKTALSVVAIASVGLMAVSSAVHAQDFIVDSPFTVNGVGSPALHLSGTECQRSSSALCRASP
jgi:hypothetical protein